MQAEHAAAAAKHTEAVRTLTASEEFEKARAAKDNHGEAMEKVVEDLLAEMAAGR